MVICRFCRHGFPHSEICGSKDVCSLPQLFAACHVLHRLEVPRHPPCALSSLTIKFTHEQQNLSRATLLDACTVNFALCVFYLTPRSIKLNTESDNSHYSIVKDLLQSTSGVTKTPKIQHSLS